MVNMSIVDLSQRCYMTVFEAIIQMVAFLIFSIMLVLKEDFDIQLTWFDVYLPILIGDFFHLYHTFICFIRLRLQACGVWESVAFPQHQRCQFVKRKVLQLFFTIFTILLCKSCLSFVFTLLIGLSKFFFYQSVEQTAIGDGMATKRYRTGNYSNHYLNLLYSLDMLTHS